MLCGCIAFVLLSQPGVSELPTPDQLFRIIRELHSYVRDLTATFEGRIRLVGPGRIDSKRQEEFERWYQGFYCFRNDESYFQDVYLRGSSLQGLTRVKTAIFKGMVETLVLTPDDASLVPMSRAKRGTAFALYREFSPHKIFFFWYFRRITDPDSYKCICEGWQPIDGRKCLKVRLNLSQRRTGKSAPEMVFWIDMERGGHPLRADYILHPPHVAMSSYGIELHEFTLPNGKVTWLPISGVADTYVSNGEYVKEPVLRETYRLVPTSLMINRGVRDKTFSIRNVDERGAGSSLVLREEFLSESKTRSGRFQTDPASVQEGLERRLADADRKAKMIQASSAARNPWSWTLILQCFFGISGLTLIVVALYRRSNLR